MNIFYFIRHGEPDWNFTLTRNLHPCRHDFIPLTETGVREAEEVSRNNSLRGASRILSSPYTRALQTASIISRYTDLPITVEYDLHERLVDTSYSVSSVEELFRLCSEWEALKGEPASPASPLWEPISAIRSRVTGVLKKYRNSGEVIVVCHELVIRSMVGADKRIPHCGIEKITWDDVN